MKTYDERPGLTIAEIEKLMAEMRELCDLRDEQIFRNRIKLEADPDMEPGTLELRNPDGSVAAKVFNIGTGDFGD